MDMDYIRGFVELNIDKMERDKWDQVFLEWYLDTMDSDNSSNEPYEFRELLRILTDVGFDRTKINEGRTSTVVVILNKLVDDLIVENSSKHRYQIPFRQVVNILYSKLGFSRDELNNLLVHITRPEIELDKEDQMFRIHHNEF